MKNKIMIFTATVNILILTCSINAYAQQTSSISVYVISPSISTSMEARNIRAENRWIEETNARMADAILVVVRSSLFNPLDNYYYSLKELEDDAEMQLNISGPKFHIYLYTLNNDLTISQIKHVSYAAH